MKALYILFLIFFCSSLCLAQDASSNKEADLNYKEDQFYIAVTYNLLSNKPNGLSQRGFSGGLHFGFIKDMPINEKRNVAIGLGLGYSGNSLNNNMFINKTNSGTDFSILDASTTNYSKNKFAMHLIEVPLEFRWRTSTPEAYNFWRIYTGFKFGYLFSHSAKFQGDLGTFNHKNIDAFNTFQYGLTLAAGYNTWNVYCYYGLNSIFTKDSKIGTEVLDMNTIKIGLQFYIL